MASSSTVDQHLGEWLGAATVEISSEQHVQWRAAVAAMSTALDVNTCIQITAAAHADISDSARDWMGGHLRAQDPAFSPNGKELLLAILAGAVVVETLDAPGHAHRTLVFLLVDSARCTQLSPKVADVRSCASRVGAEIRRAVRKRSLDQKPISQLITDALNAAKVDPAAPELTVAVGAVDAHDSALRQIAGRLFEVNGQLATMLALQEEELDTLWWSYGGLSSTTGEYWEKVVPVERRALLASVELRRLVTRTPSPPSSRALLARALGDAAATQTTLAQVAEAAVEFLDDFVGLPDHRLIPIASAARQRQKMGGEDDTWEKVVTRTLGYATDTTMSTLDAAEQALREFDIRVFF